MCKLDFEQYKLDAGLTHFKVHCHTKSMIHIITDLQIAYVCETDQMVGFHIVLTLIK